MSLPKKSLHIHKHDIVIQNEQYNYITSWKISLVISFVIRRFWIENKLKENHWSANSLSPHLNRNRRWKREILLINSELGWDFFLPVSRMIENVCFLKAMQFTLDVLLRAYWFTLFHSEYIPAESSAHKQRLQLCRGEWCTPAWKYDYLNLLFITSQNSNRRKGC